MGRLNIMSYTGALINFISSATSPFHTVATAEKFLAENEFIPLDLSEDWQIEVGKKYYINVYNSTLIAFTAHENLRAGMRIAAAHTDFPCFKLKPHATFVQNSYGKLNVEVYGGMILNTWLDRPLSIAGKVVLKGQNAFAPEVKLIDFARALVTIPNLAIHMDRRVNEGKALNRQKEMLPLAFLAMDKDSKSDEDCLLKLLAQEAKCNVKDILAYELYVYQIEKGCYVGFNNEMISSPRLDNLTSVKACIEGIIAAKRTSGLDVSVIFDNEEVGSRTKQGGASLIFAQVLERIYTALGYNREQFLADIAKSFMLSIDVAHAMHPNYPEKNDITNKPILNKGFALKTSASQSYAGDAQAVAIVKALCKQHNIAYQEYVNRSDIPGGSTLGSIASTLLPVRTMDIGIPILAMHSARETMGKKDQKSLENLVKAFFAD